MNAKKTKKQSSTGGKNVYLKKDFMQPTGTHKVLICAVHLSILRVSSEEMVVETMYNLAVGLSVSGCISSYALRRNKSVNVSALFLVSTMKVR